MKLTDKIFDLISAADIFCSTDKAVLRSILIENEVEIEEYKKNEIIYGKNSFRKAIGIILKGNARVVKTESGAIISTLKQGSIFGCVSFFATKDYYVNDIISAGECKVIYISKDSCEKLLKTDENFALEFIKYLSDRLYFLNTRIDSFTASTTECKVISYLLSKFEAENTSEITLSMSRLAQSVNIARASVYRAIQDLCDRGLIKKENKTIVIINAEKLRELLPR